MDVRQHRDAPPIPQSRSSSPDLGSSGRRVRRGYSFGPPWRVARTRYFVRARPVRRRETDSASQHDTTDYAGAPARLFHPAAMDLITFGRSAPGSDQNALNQHRSRWLLAGGDNEHPPIRYPSPPSRHLAKHEQRHRHPPRALGPGTAATGPSIWPPESRFPPRSSTSAAPSCQAPGSSLCGWKSVGPSPHFVITDTAPGTPVGPHAPKYPPEALRRGPVHSPHPSLSPFRDTRLQVEQTEVSPMKQAFRDLPVPRPLPAPRPM